MDREYVIDGARTASLDDFFEEFSRVVIPGFHWGWNLNAFNDVLRGGFGTPDEGFVLRWTNSEMSKVLLGYPETVRALELAVQGCDPSNSAGLVRELSDARRGVGPTIFDWLVEIISIHGPGGTESEDNVRLILE